MGTNPLAEVNFETGSLVKRGPITELDLTKAKLLLSPKLVHLANEEGWHLFFDPNNHVWVRLNESGKEIIETIARQFALDATINSLGIQYGVNPDSIREKVVGFIRRMIDAGIIHIDAYKAFESTDSLGDRHPANVYFSNTERCNLSCVYCYNAQSRKLFGKFRGEMTTAETIKALGRLWDFGVSTVAFCGGEPMCRSDLLEIAGYAKKQGFRTALITNGTLITEKNAPIVADMFDLLWVSLDSHIKEEHEALRGKGSFDRTMGAVKMLARLNPKRLVVNSVVCNINVRTMPETHRFFEEEIGVSKHRMGAFFPTKDVVRDKNNNPITSVLFDEGYHKFLIDAGLKLELSGDELPPLTIDEHDGLIVKQAPKRSSCGFANGDIHMVSNGDIYPCVMMYRKEFRAGNILTEDIETIYRESPAMKECREATVDSIEECSECFVKNVCAGGCRATAYEMYGDLKAYHKDLCPLLKKASIDSLWLDSRIPFDKMDEAEDIYKKRLTELREEQDYSLSESHTI